MTDKLVLADGFSPQRPRPGVALAPHMWSLGSKSECPKKEEMETVSFLNKQALGPKTSSVVSAQSVGQVSHRST